MATRSATKGRDPRPRPLGKDEPLMQAKSDPPEVEGDPNAVVLAAILVLIVAGMVALAWLLTVLLSTFEAVSGG